MFGLWVYRTLLRIYPEPFRRLYGRELEVDFEALLRRAHGRGRWVTLRLWWRVTVDTVRSGLRERLSRRGYRGGGGSVLIPHANAAGWMTDGVQDLRLGLRSLSRSPGYAVAVLITLALGIGANTALFSVAYGTLLRPLPFEDGEQLVRLIHEVPPPVDPSAPAGRVGFSVADLEAYAERVPGLQEMSEYHSMTFTLIDSVGPHRVRAGVVSANYFDFLGLTALHGRLLHPSEDHLGAEPVIVLTHRYWQDRFGGDPAVIGTRVRMNDRVHEIVGVLPPGPQFPLEGDLFLPISACPTRSDPAFIADPAARMMFAYARVEPGLAVDVAESRADSILAALAVENPAAYSGGGGLAVRAVSLRHDMGAELRPITAALLAVAGLVWLVACANAAGLALARAGRRMRELEVRSALGAGRGRLVRTLLVESVVLALVGGALGWGLAAAGQGLLVEFAERFTTRAQEIRLDRAVLVFAAATSVLAGLVFGAVPGWWVGGRTRVAPSGSGGGSLGPQGRRIQRALVVGQVAVAFAVVSSAGLALRTVWAVGSVDLGFETGSLVSFEVALDQERWHHPDSARALFARVVARLEQEEGVVGAVRLVGGPLTGQRHHDTYTLGEGAARSGGVGAIARVVDPGFFQMLGFELIEGRVFSKSDRPGSEPVAVVNRSFHTRFMAGRYALGTVLTRCHSPGQDCLPPLRVVGVVDDVRFDGADTEVGPEVYQVARQATDYGGEHIVARVLGDAARLEAVIVSGIHDIEPDLAVSDYTSLDGLRRDRDRPRRFLAWLLGALAVVAAGLAVTGIFGVAALSAASRTRELGLRRALGASPRGLVTGVLLEGVGVAVLGIGIGVVLASAFSLAFARFFQTVLWGVAPHDPLTWLASGVLFVAVAVAATWLPARRVGRVDVMRVLNEL